MNNLNENKVMKWILITATILDCLTDEAGQNFLVQSLTLGKLKETCKNVKYYRSVFILV